MDLSTATAASINALRQAALYQQILELDARAGTRYVESIYSKFGVVSPDFRLQRPELIGQGHSRINVYAIPQTAATGATGTPQGNLAAFGTAQIQGGHGCQYSATEHGILMGLLNVRADLTYQQGIPRMFTRSTRLDFYEPLQVGLGEQTIFNGEIYAQGTSADLSVFAYQERFAEYRLKILKLLVFSVPMILLLFKSGIFLNSSVLYPFLMLRSLLRICLSTVRWLWLPLLRPLSGRYVLRLFTRPTYACQI